MSARLSTCARCGGTIERRLGSVAGWGHVSETARNADGHRPEPDDGYVAAESDEEPDPLVECRRRADGSLMSWGEYERIMSL